MNLLILKNKLIEIKEYLPCQHGGHCHEEQYVEEMCPNCMLSAALNKKINEIKSIENSPKVKLYAMIDKLGLNPTYKTDMLSLLEQLKD